MDRRLRVEVVGPESSGTRWLTALVASLGVVAIHRPVPRGTQWWPVLGRPDHTILIWRDTQECIASQIRNGRVNPGWTPERRYATSEAVIAEHVLNPALVIRYEALCHDTQGNLDRVADRLGVPRIQVHPRLVSKKP